MRWIMIGLIKLYRRFISPLKPACCRFTPTCSSYALEAFTKRGFFVGFALSFYRILRCNPFCKAGYDPVPERGARQSKKAGDRLQNLPRVLAEQTDTHDNSDTV